MALPKLTKPKQYQVIKLEGRVVGHIWLDNRGYFYRPKSNRTSLWDAKHDGEHFASVAAVMASLNDHAPHPGPF